MLTKGHIIAIEGIIGVGKSTLTQGLAMVSRMIPHFESVDDNYFLNDYYSDPARWAFTLQCHMLYYRFNQMKQAQHEAACGFDVLMDRTIMGDYAFALVQKRDGYFSEKEFDSYKRMHETLVQQIVYPDLMIWLDIEPEAVVERIQKRSRDCESNISLDYLKHLNDAYQSVLERLAWHTKIVRVNARESAETVLANVNGIIADHKKSDSSELPIYA